MINSIDFLEQLRSKGTFTALDFHIARFFIQKVNLDDHKQSCRLAFLILWMSVEIRSGHVCIDLAQLSRAQFDYRLGRDIAETIFEQLGHPKLTDWLQLCNQLGHDIIGNSQNLTPLILHENKLYFQRLWLYEKQVAQFFGLGQQLYISNDKQKMIDIINNLFPDTHSGEIDWQKVAVVSALTRRIAIISGGPGTGKTTTISKLLVALVKIIQEPDAKKIQIMATAPTGKAAARLTESLSNALSHLNLPSSIKNSLPTEAITLHRLLGARPNTNQYSYNEQNKLSIDVLLIDEASMVDLPMMAKVIAALPAHCRLILLGDKEQLSSVEAGAVFGDLCELYHRGYSQPHVKMINELCAYQLTGKTEEVSLADCVCLLQKSYRFNNHSGIGQLANLIKAGEHQTVLKLLNNNQHIDVIYNTLINQQQYLKAIEYSVNHYRNYFLEIVKQPVNIKHILNYFAQYRLLCALREGAFGVDGLNKVIEQTLENQQIIQRTRQQPWYVGRPIMILRNSFTLGLFNGDIGITLPDPDDASKLRVYFLLPNGEIKGFSPYRLPEHETVYAMTIHKSQGSEFDHISIVLPNEYSPILTRSLLYTAVTRAKQKVAIFSESTILTRTIQTKTQRQSGLLTQLKNIELTTITE